MDPGLIQPRHDLREDPRPVLLHGIWGDAPMKPPRRVEGCWGEVVEPDRAQRMLPVVALVAPHHERSPLALADLVEIAPHPSVASLPRPVLRQLPHEFHADGENGITIETVPVQQPDVLRCINSLPSVVDEIFLSNIGLCMSRIAASNLVETGLFDFQSVLNRILNPHKI